MYVRLWHPAFPHLPPQIRTQVAFLFLDNLLGEDDVERWVGRIEADEAAAEGRTPADLEADIRAKASAATGDRWVVAQGTDGGGNPVLARYNATLKRIDHPDEDQHLAVAIDKGLDDLANTNALPPIEAAEEELVRALDGVAIEAARVTERKRRTTHFVTGDAARALEIATEWCAAHPDPPARVAVAPDVRWDFRREYGG